MGRTRSMGVSPDGWGREHNGAMADELKELLVKDAAAWRAWLVRHHADSPGVLAGAAQEGMVRLTELDYEAALQEALCFGWIDGQGRRRDAETSFQRMTRRGRKASGRAGTWNASGASKRRAGWPRRGWRRQKAQGGRPLGGGLLGPGLGGGPEDLAAAIAAEPRAQAMFDV